MFTRCRVVLSGVREEILTYEAVRWPDRHLSPSTGSRYDDLESPEGVYGFVTLAR